MAASTSDLLSGGYDFFVPPRIAFGWGRRSEVGKIARTLGSRRAFVVAGSRTLAASGALDEIATVLAATGLEVVINSTASHEPEVADVDNLVAFLRAEHAGDGDVMIAVGGGSALDLAKAAGALATNGEGASVVDYLEGVGRGLSIVHPPIPLLAMPTTGGTGTEATKNAVISSYDPPFKKSLRSDLMVPRAVLVDPELSVSVPAGITAACGMDAITQCIESYISRRAKPMARPWRPMACGVPCPRLSPRSRSRRIAPHARRWPMRRYYREWRSRILTGNGAWSGGGARRARADAAWVGLRRDAARGACDQSPALPGGDGRVGSHRVGRIVGQRRRGG